MINLGSLCLMVAGLFLLTTNVGAGIFVAFAGAAFALQTRYTAINAVEFKNDL